MMSDSSYSRTGLHISVQSFRPSQQDNTLAVNVSANHRYRCVISTIMTFEWNVSYHLYITCLLPAFHIRRRSYWWPGWAEGCLWGPKQQFEPDRDVFLTLTKWLLCLNLNSAYNQHCDSRITDKSFNLYHQKHKLPTFILATRLTDNECNGAQWEMFSSAHTWHFHSLLDGTS